MSQLTIEFFSKCLVRPVTFKMIIPNDINPDWNPEQKRKDKPMKTLFLLHGYTGAAGNWIPEQLCTLYNFAIVMPSGENGFWIDGISTGHKYGTFLAEELVDYVRNTFHLAMCADDTYIMGMSMGGYGALHAALAYPERFGKAIGLSSAILIKGLKDIKPGVGNSVANYEYYRECFGDLDKVEETGNNPEVLVNEIIESGANMPEIFMACGTEDFLLEPNRDLHKFLEEKKIEHHYYESKGGHDMEFWDEYAKKLVPMLFEESSCFPVK